MVLRADHGLLPVRMVRKEQLVHCLQHFADVLVQAAVVFLIHSFKLGVESADHHVFETLALNCCPVVQLVGGNVLHVAGLVLTREGI